MKFRARAWKSKVVRTNYVTKQHGDHAKSFAYYINAILLSPKTSITTHVCSCMLRARPE